jgi:hypothetical protein
VTKRHKFILISDDQAVIEFDSNEPYTQEKAKLLSQQVTNLMKTKSSIILSPDFEFIDRRPGYLRIEERLRNLERAANQSSSKVGVASGVADSMVPNYPPAVAYDVNGTAYYDYDDDTDADETMALLPGDTLVA